MKPDYKLVAKAKYIHANADLASEIWHEVYKRYYPAKQLDTLVETLQSADAIEADIDNDVNYFLVVLGGKTIGYFAWKMENTALHLMKDGLRSFLSAAPCQKCTAKKCSGADKKSSTFQKWSPRCVFWKAVVSTIGEESNAIGLITNGITDKQRKSMTSVV